jgi:AcrR family transcriptional regulator
VAQRSFSTRAGDERREVILERAAQLASVTGLEALTLGRLAAEVGTTKSTLQSLFGTKQELQLAVVANARQVFDARVVAPLDKFEDGLARLRALIDTWLDYLAVFPGGCFFFAAAAEFDGRPGPVRDAVVDVAHQGRRLLTREIHLAKRLGELAGEVDTDQLAFELHSLVVEANLVRQLFDDPQASERARRAAVALLERHAGEGIQTEA